MKVNTANLILGIGTGIVGCGAGALIAIGDVHDAKSLITGFVGMFIGHTVGNVVSNSSNNNPKQ